MEPFTEISHIIGSMNLTSYLDMKEKLDILVVSLPHHPQDVKEEVQNVEVESDGCPDVLIIGESFDQIVRVIDNVSREDDRTDASIDSN